MMQIREPDRIYQGRHLRPIDAKEYPKYFVYAWKNNRAYLYIGKTSRGWKRFKGHNIIGDQEIVHYHDVIEFWFFNTQEEIDIYEIFLIQQLQPIFNKNKYNQVKIVNKEKKNRKRIERVEEPIEIPFEIITQCRSDKEYKELVKAIKLGNLDEYLFGRERD